MERLQLGVPRYLGFMVAAFFAGTIALAVGMARLRLLSWLAPGIAVLGSILLLAAGLLPQGPGLHRRLGLVGLGLVSASLCWVGLAVARERG
jgi:hypothetical protein